MNVVVTKRKFCHQNLVEVAMGEKKIGKIKSRTYTVDCVKYLHNRFKIIH